MRKCPTIKLRVFFSSSSSSSPPQQPETDYCRFNRFDYITLFLSHVCDDRSRKRVNKRKSLQLNWRDNKTCTKVKWDSYDGLASLLNDLLLLFVLLCLPCIPFPSPKPHFSHDFDVDIFIVVGIVADPLDSRQYIYKDSFLPLLSSLFIFFAAILSFYS